MYLETEIKTNPINKKKNVITVIFAIAFILIFLFICQILVMTLSYNKVYDGVYLNSDRVSHLSKDELRQLINNKYNEPLRSATITLTFGDMKWDIDAKELNLLINEEKIIEELYAPGHEGNIFKRLSDIVKLRMNQVHINIFDTYSDFISYDKDKVDEIAEKISKESYSDVVQHQISVNNKTVMITSGHNGYNLPADMVRNTLIETLNKTNSVHADLEKIAKVTKPDSLDIKKVSQDLYVPAENAQYEKKEKGGLIIKPHKYGHKVNENDLAQIINSLDNNPDKSYTLNLIEIEPEIKSDSVKLPTFNDTLGKKTTSFTAGDKNRNTNIARAAEVINGTYLFPGEVFSFNAIVGDTTAEKGYKPAGTFLNGKLVDAYGGGVCQVSTTLYNAVINAGLEVVERSPHSLKVGYVPLGMDAAIAIPYKDFKFKNNTSDPILITAVTTSTNITFTIKGVNNNPNIKYEFESEIISETPFKTVYQDDPTLPKGQTKVLQSGTDGYSVKTYRTTYINGQKVKRELFSSSKYSPRNKIIAKGTK